MKKLIVVIVAIISCAACTHKETHIEAEKKLVLSDTMLNMIRTDTVRECYVTGELSLSGEVSSNENNVVKIFPRSSGQVIESPVSLGDRVTAGQTLAVIKSADVAGNYNDLNSASADLAIAKRQMDNAESLYKSGIASEREFTEAKQGYQKALAARDKIQSLININGGGKTSEGGRYVITSPINGYIVEKRIATGSFIRQDMGDNLFTISDLKNVWVYANVYEADIPRIREGYAAKVIPMAYPDKVFIGKIDKMSQVLDPQSKVMRVRISLNNSDMLLKPEMFAKVLVSNEEGQKSICIPNTAVISQDGKNYVVLFRSRDDMSVAEVDIAKTVGDVSYIRSGVQPGQVLVTQHQLFIFNQLTNE
jgi:cobalt-zinc-cadmium efflux system membrane fusion protein